MQPVSFEESNCTYENNGGISINGIDVASAFQGHTKDDIPIVVTCWKMTEEELEEFQRTGRIWVLTLGHVIPIQQLFATKPLERKNKNEGT